MKSKIFIQFLFVLLPTVFVFQNCQRNLETSQVSLCSNSNSLCVGNRNLMFFNEILIDLGTISNVSTKPDADGFTHFEIYNPVSTRRAYLKVRFKQSHFELFKDETKSDKEHMCHDPSQGLCDTVVTALGNTDTNCASTIRYYDGETMQTLNSEPNGLARSNACTPIHYNIEVLGSNQKAIPDQDLNQLFQGCKCRVNSLKLGKLSSNLQTNYLNNPIVKTAFSRQDCSSIPSTFANLGEGFFSECNF